jgi:Putative protein-S-isoprenylcysteine methyltransferase
MKSVKIRNLSGYLLGLVVFVILIPAVMWLASGCAVPEGLWFISLAVLSPVGIGLSVWSIVHMKRVGKGNPMDAFNHEIAPRTSRLMTDGPYKICRNPMLLGIFIYYAGVVIWLHSWQAAAVFAAFVLIMAVQVKREEKRLEQDFGDAYREYKKSTKKLIPFVW